MVATFKLRNAVLFDGVQQPWRSHPDSFNYNNPITGFEITCTIPAQIDQYPITTSTSGETVVTFGQAGVIGILLEIAERWLPPRSLPEAWHKRPITSSR